MRTFATAILSVLLLSTVVAAAEPSAADLESRRKALNDLLAEQWEYTLETNPEYASILGDKRWNDKSSDDSDAAVAEDLVETADSCAVRGDRHRRLSRAGAAQQER